MQRVSEAIKIVDDEIFSVFIGRKGDSLPTCDNILFVGQCTNEKVAKYLQAGDCFVLPTKSEGCCNAILEALSTGLPVISSDRPFNDGILSNDNSIRVDPENINEIAIAIKELKANKDLKNKLSAGAIRSSKEFGIRTRAERVYNFVLDSIQKIT